MYGTIFRLQPKQGREKEIVALMNEWSESRAPNVEGAQAAYLLQSERRPGEFVAVAVFDDEQTYRANAGSPDQESWYRRLRDTLEGDPIWEDGPYLSAFQFGNGPS
jgi:quinol monooxygenase YgiN